MEPSNEFTLGIIAGAGRFPFMVARGAKSRGHRVVVIALRGLADPALAESADTMYWSGLARLGRWIRLFRRRSIHHVVFAGSVRKTDMYGRFRLLRFLPDWTTLRLWFFRLQDKRNDTILRGLADELARKGIHVEECIRFCSEDLAPPGVLTALQPTAAQLKDLRFGWTIAKELGRLDVGQSVAVKETEVIAVEAIEGTDRMIERAGALCPSGGWTLIKVAKPNQDMRFDVPTVGPETLANLHAHGGKMLVIEAHRTLIIDREAVLSAAARHGIVIVAGPLADGVATPLGIAAAH